MLRLLVILLVLTAPTLSQYKIENWTTEQGLPQNSVNAILQSRTGYLWLGTFGGLVRFDGVNFQVYDRSNLLELKSDRILCLQEDVHGGFWLGTENGGLYRFFNGQLAAPLKNTPLELVSILTLYIDRQHTVWAGTSGHGLVRIDSSGSVKHYTMVDGLWNNSVTALGDDGNGNVLIATPQGINRIFVDNKVVVREVELTMKVINSIVLKNDDSVLLTGDQVFAVWRDDLPGKLQRIPRFSHLYVRDLIEDKRNRLWAAEYPGGLLMIDAEGGRSFGAADGLKSTLVRSLCFDREGNLWIGTDGGGLHRLREVPFTVLGIQEGLRNEIILGMAISKSGGLWVGTNCGGLHFIEGKAVRVYDERHGLTSDCVWSVGEDAKGSLWVGTWAGAVSRMVNGVFIPNQDGQTYPVPNVLAILTDSRGHTWFGSTGRGLYRFDGKNWTHWDMTKGLISNDVRTLFEDTDGSLWIGTVGGLQHLSDEVLRSPGQEQRLAGKYVRSILRDRDGYLWVGTYGSGLFALHRGNVVNINTSVGLFDNIVSVILEDDMGNLWMSSNRGVYRVVKSEAQEFVEGKRSSVRSFSYGLGDGLRSVECNGGFYPSGLILADGRLAFPTIKGIAFLDPRKVNINTLAPPVVIEELLVDNVHQDIDKPLEFSHTANRFQFRFTALSFTAPHKSRFEFMMEGHDNHWIDGGTRRVVEYTSLGSGKYRFRVRAANNDGVWNEEGTSLAFIILTPFWRTWWFLTLVVGTVGFGIYGIYHRRVRVLELRHEQERKFSQDLMQSEQRYRALFERYRGLVENINEVYYIVDAEGKISYASPTFFTMSGYSQEEVIGQLYSKFIAREDKRWVIRQYQHITQDGTVDTSCVCRIGRKDGSRLWIEQTTRVIRDEQGNVIEYRNIVRDISDRRKAQELQEAFSRQVLASQENERKRISSELHDSLGQNLLIIKNRALLGLHDGVDLEHLKEQLREISELTSQTIDEARVIAHDLRPYQLDRLGLRKTIASMVNKLASLSDITIITDLDDLRGILSKEHEIHVFRIMQEVLSNVVRHSKATEARVSIHVQPDSLMIRVEDNGVGIQARPLKHVKAGEQGFGLIGISERVRLLQGNFDVDSSPSSGTTITIHIPIFGTR